MFWPPRPGSRLPPTKATSARPQTAAELADRVDQDHRRAGRRTGRSVARLVEPAPAHDRLALLLEPLGHALEPLGMTRHQDQPQARVLATRGPVGRQRRRFLALHRAAGHEDQVGRREAQQLAAGRASAHCSGRSPGRRTSPSR